jgi:hypothetical protein
MCAIVWYGMEYVFGHLCAHTKNNDREHTHKNGESSGRLSFMTRAHIRAVILPSLHPSLSLSSEGSAYTRIRNKREMKKRWKMDRQRFFFFFLSHTYIYIYMSIRPWQYIQLMLPYVPMEGRKGWDDTYHID